MNETYQAVLNGNLIEWQGQVPPLHGPMRVEVTFVEDALKVPAPQQKRAMLDALKSLAASGTFNEIEDPIAWQREIRKDRVLPDREE